MENKVIRREVVKDDIILEYKELPIEVYENLIKQFKEKGATHIDVYADKDWDGYVENLEFTGVKLFFETDEEKEIRLKKEQQEIENKELEANRKKRRY